MINLPVVISNIV